MCQKSYKTLHYVIPFIGNECNTRARMLLVRFLSASESNSLDSTSLFLVVPFKLQVERIPIIFPLR